MDIAINIAGWLVAAMTLGLMFYQHHLAEKRLACATDAQQRAERELSDIRSRGEGPYLSPSNQLCGHIYEQTGKETISWSTNGTNVLWAHRDEVNDLKPGDPIILLLENHGKDARRITLDTALENCTIKQEPVFDSSHGYLFLKYDYEPEQHGKAFTICMSFESQTGLQDTHVYETIHGKRDFRRVKP